MPSFQQRSTNNFILGFAPWLACLIVVNETLFSFEIGKNFVNQRQELNAELDGKDAGAEGGPALPVLPEPKAPKLLPEVGWACCEPPKPPKDGAPETDQWKAKESWDKDDA